MVGAGIAGLAAAYALCRDSGDRVRVSLLEGSPQVGGKLRVSEVAGLPVDEGAESMLARRPEGLDLAAQVGLGDEVVPAATAAAGVVRGAAVRPLPAGQLMGVPTDVRALAAARVLPPVGLVRVLADRVLPASPVHEDVAVGRYVAGRMGRAVVDRLVDPLLGGVYAGRADALSLQATVPALAEVARSGRSLLAGARRVRAAGDGEQREQGPVFVGLPGGVGRLAARVRDAAEAAGATVRTDAPVRELARTPDGWCLTVGPTSSPQTVHADAVVLAVPARPASRLLAEVAPAAATELAGIGYASVAVLTLAFARGTVGNPPAGSGFLVPAVERRLVTAVTMSSAKWGWLQAADPDTLVLRCSVGRFGAEATLQRDDADLVAAARADLAELAGVHGSPVDTRVTRWGGALPQYGVGHPSRVARIKAAVRSLPRLAVCGAAYEGLGIPACVAGAEQASARVLAGLADLPRPPSSADKGQ